MIHDYGYEEAIPYKFIKYKKQDKVEFTEEIKSELDNYYRDIRKLTESNYLIDGKADIKKLTKDLGGKYKSIRARFIIPFTGKESCSSQELDFLFVCCYELYLKFHLNQTEMNKIWGINGDKLDRLDWYPHRSFSAYRSACDKTLKPYDTDSLGAKIAKVMNQKVQAVYMCGAFTGITNDLDLFANVSVDRTKCFILTSPLQFSDDDVSSIQRANYALARMLFASGGHVNSIKACKGGVFEYNIRVNPEAEVQIPIKPAEEFNPQYDSANLFIDNSDATLICEFELSYEDAKNYASMTKGKFKVKRVHFEKPITVRVFANL